MASHHDEDQDEAATDHLPVTDEGSVIKTPQEQMADEKQKKRKRTRRIVWLCVKIVVALVLLGGIAALVILSTIPNSPIQTALIAFLQWLKDIPEPLAVVLFIVFYAVANTLFIPGTPLDLAAGLLFGIVFGGISAVVGLLLAAMVSFLLGRTLFRKWALEKSKKYPKLRALDIVIGEKGFFLVFLIRLSPLMPFSLCSYVLGSMNISFISYSLASLAGLTLPTVGYVYLGTLITQLTSIFKGATHNYSKIVWLALVACSTLFGIAFVSYITKRTLDKVVAEEEAKRLVSGKPSDIASAINGEAAIPAALAEEMPSTLVFDYGSTVAPLSSIEVVHSIRPE